MAGLAFISGQQRHDLNGRPYVGARATFYLAGTTTPMSVYQDYGLGVDHPNPVEADGFGVFPPIYLDEADEFYRVRLATAEGVLISDTDSLPIIGPTGGGGGGETPVDPNGIFKTGDEKWRFGTGAHTGWVRENGRTIGSATSGATERANADTEALFLHLWAADETLTVSGGRGASAAADWAANKTISLPDMKGRAIFGLDDMGATAAGRITGGTTLGGAGGAETVTLVTGNLPSHTHTGTTDSSGSHGHPTRVSTGENAGSNSSGGFQLDSDADASYPAHDSTTPGTAAGDQIGMAGDHTHTFTTDATGSGTAVNKMPPYGLRTLYIKL